MPRDITLVRFAFLCVLMGTLICGSSARAQEKPAEPGSPAKPTAPKQVLKRVLAEDVYKNVEIMKGHPAEQVLPMMFALRGLLGVDCSYCHTPFKWESDDIKSKPTTRLMFHMQEFINESTFEGKERVNCWTCHRGAPIPNKSPGPFPPPQTELFKKIIGLKPEDENKPAEVVFKNIKSFQGMPAGKLPAVMAWLSESLGVKCNYCHVKPFESDEKPQKLMARKMLAMVTGISKNFYAGGDTPIECYNCHQGQPKPPEGWGP